MEKQPPLLETERLILRPFTLDDASDVQRLAGAPEIADTTLGLPHPYEYGMAEQWIAGHDTAFQNNAGVYFAVIIAENGMLCGKVNLVEISLHHSHAQLGYWVGVPFWNRGYCTEASAALIEYGFHSLGLHRIHSQHFTRNPASGRVLQKLGFVHEGCQRQHIKQSGKFADLEQYGLLVSEWHLNSSKSDR